MALAALRRHQRWFYFLLVVVILGFIAFYIPAFRGSDAGTPLATLGRVGGLPITVGEYRQALDQKRRELEQMYRGRLDPAMLKRLGLEDQVFEELVTERLLTVEARRLGLTVDDDAVARAITTDPRFQSNGHFLGKEEIQRRLDLGGISPEDFEQTYRENLLRQRLFALVTDGVSVSPAEVEREFRRRSEQVKIEYVLADAARFRGQVVVGDDEARARFEGKKEAYRLPEQREVSYLLLDERALEARTAVTDRDADAYYQDHREDFKEEEQACASHILVKTRQTEKSSEGHPDAEARSIAQAALDKIQGGADFAAVAQKVSEDKASAIKGGDLGCFPRQRMLPEFEKTAFTLEAGRVSDLVKTALGYHIIRVNSHKSETIPPVAEVRDRIKKTLSQQRGQALLEGQADAIAARLAKGGSLVEAGQGQGLTPQKSPAFARGEPVPPLDSPALLARAFELKKGEVAKEPFQVSKGYAFIALDDVKPSRLPDWKDVAQKVKADLGKERALEKAREAAEKVRGKAEGAGLDKAASALGFVRKETPGPVGRSLPLGDLGSGAQLDEQVFALPEKTLSDPIRVQDGYAIVRVLERKPFDAKAFDEARASLIQGLRAQKKNELFQAYLSQARRRVSVEKDPAALRRLQS